MKIIKFITVVFMLTSVVACGRIQPVKNVQSAPVAFNLTTAQVESAILRAGIDRGWVMKEIKPGVIRAQIFVRSHSAVVDIDYSNKSYSIKYVSSDNLEYHNGKIHRNYNRWVNNLDVDIKHALAKIAL
ncbi:MAG: hypothetical protein LPD71_14145 [Shewanella sp.]|nr:hypothetical protein [Shewanella sp.]MCF1431122.1 hypothetical protein [Shewanella sp.]MCF1439830.1 hypothetical protein [Shewanella sp.]MCF1458670.1 hypothetical protein [Shewanella sp.]